MKDTISDQINKYIQLQCTSLMNRVKSHPNKYRLSLTVRSDAKDKDGKVKSFAVKGVVKISKAADLRASKKNSNAKTAVDEVIKALEKQLQRWSEKQERSRSTVGKTLKPVKEYKYELSVK